MSISEPRSKQFDLDQVRRILILRMGPLGETLLTTPVIRALRRRFPEAYIAYMVAPGREDLVSENPNLDEVITYSVSIPKLIYEMTKRSFQMVVILQPTFRLVLHTFLARIPFRIGFETNSGKGRCCTSLFPIILISMRPLDTLTLCTVLELSRIATNRRCL